MNFELFSNPEFWFAVGGGLALNIVRLAELAMDSDTKEYLLGIMNYIRRLEVSAIEDARRYQALMDTLEKVIPGAGSEYRRQYEHAEKTLSGRPQLEKIDQIIQKLNES